MAVPSSKSIHKLQDQYYLHASEAASPSLSLVKKSAQETVFQIPIFADFSTHEFMDDDDIFKAKIMSSTTTGSSFNEEEVSTRVHPIIIYHVNYISTTSADDFLNYVT